MDRSTYLYFVNGIQGDDPHTLDDYYYPHKDMISFIVVTQYAPKSTYSPKLTRDIVDITDLHIRKTVDGMMGLNNKETIEEDEEQE
jgi:hypothetical protein